MFENLSHIKLGNFADTKVQETIALLLNVIETQQKQINEQKQVMQELRDEIARLKGEIPKPVILPNTKGKDISSEKETHPPKTHNKEPKKDKIPVDRTIICTLDKSGLPSDLIYKGTESVISQDIIFKRDNTKYIVEIWYSPSQNRIYRSPYPEEYTGYFGNSLKTFCLMMHYGLDVTRTKLIRFLSSMGITMSDGSLHNILIQDSQMWLTEKIDILRNGLQSLFLQTDSTGARVHGKNHRTHIFVSEFFTVFSTMPTKSRLDILLALQGEPATGLVLQYNQTAQDFLEHYRISQSDKTIIQTIFAQNTMFFKTDFEELVERQYPKLLSKVTTFKWIIESLAFGHYFEQTQYLCPKILISDDAKEYQLLSQNHSLCWVHDARYYNKLMPVLEAHREILDNFKERYWTFYRQLKEYTQNPSSELKAQLQVKFDEIFVPNTKYFDLDKEIQRTLSNKHQLLTVLEFPFIPLHNNAAELAARVQVRKRDISLHTMSKLGTKLQDAFLSIIQTSFQLGINAYQYISDRLNKKSEIYLPDVLLAKINMK